MRGARTSYELSLWVDGACLCFATGDLASRAAADAALKTIAACTRATCAWEERTARGLPGMLTTTDVLVETASGAVLATRNLGYNKAGDFEGLFWASHAAKEEVVVDEA